MLLSTVITSYLSLRFACALRHITLMAFGGLTKFQGSYNGIWIPVNGLSNFLQTNVNHIEQNNTGR